MAEAVRIENLHKSFGPVPVIRGIDLAVEGGETVVIVGSSGSGKSTLLRCINFLELPSSGRIFIEGKAVGTAVSSSDGVERIVYKEKELIPLRTRIGMVFQHFNLFPHLTALQNVMLGPAKVRGLSKKDAVELAQANLEHVGLADRSLEYPSRLSGGQQQRVVIARALAMEPMAMLFDEATSALDPELVSEVLQTMRKLAEEGMTMIIVTHELGFAYNVADRIVFLHEGKVHEEGSPREILLKPQTERLQRFIQGHTAFKLPDAVSAQARD